MLSSPKIKKKVNINPNSTPSRPFHRDQYLYYIPGTLSLSAESMFAMMKSPIKVSVSVFKTCEVFMSTTPTWFSSSCPSVPKLFDKSAS